MRTTPDRGALPAKARDLLLGLLLALVVISLGVRDARRTALRNPSPPITPIAIVARDSEVSPPAAGHCYFDSVCGRDLGSPGPGSAWQPFSPNLASPEIPLALSSDRHDQTRWRGDARAYLDAMARANRTRSSIGIAGDAETPGPADGRAEHDT
jgi:hypothetical protein